MKKKIHITEEQLECLRKSLTEDGNTTPSATNPVEFNVQKSDNGSGPINQTDMQNAARKVSNLVGQSNLSKTELTVNPKNVMGGGVYTESKTITKRQIREAKIKKLQENTVVYKKKSLK